MRDVTETLLEMHFHRAFVELFEEIYGARFLRLLKPSTRAEVWVGFDQAWVRTTCSNDELMQDLRNYVSGGAGVPRFAFGYFMQFKVVSEKKRRSRLDPQGVNPPYFRSKLSLSRSPTTGISQHETLLRVAQAPGADVTYCCPFLFDIEEIYESPDLDRVRVVDVTSSPSGWPTGGEHYIVFRNGSDNALLWCSEPTQAKALSGRDWAVARADTRQSPKELIALISAARDIGEGILDPSFTLVELSTNGGFQKATPKLQ